MSEETSDKLSVLLNKIGDVRTSFVKALGECPEENHESLTRIVQSFIENTAPKLVNKNCTVEMKFTKEGLMTSNEEKTEESSNNDAFNTPTIGLLKDDLWPRHLINEKVMIWLLEQFLLKTVSCSNVQLKENSGLDSMFHGDLLGVRLFDINYMLNDINVVPIVKNQESSIDLVFDLNHGWVAINPALTHKRFSHFVKKCTDEKEIIIYQSIMDIIDALQFRSSAVCRDFLCGLSNNDIFLVNNCLSYTTLKISGFIDNDGLGYHPGCSREFFDQLLINHIPKTWGNEYAELWLDRNVFVCNMMDILNGVILSKFSNIKRPSVDTRDIESTYANEIDKWPSMFRCAYNPMLDAGNDSISWHRRFDEILDKYQRSRS